MTDRRRVVRRDPWEERAEQNKSTQLCEMQNLQLHVVGELTVTGPTHMPVILQALNFDTS